MQARIDSPPAHSGPGLAQELSGEAPFSHRAWLHCVTAFRRLHRPGGRGFHPVAGPTIRVQVRVRGCTLCGVVIEPTNLPDGRELFRVDLADLGRSTVQARNCRACSPASCWCRQPSKS